MLLFLRHDVVPTRRFSRQQACNSKPRETCSCEQHIPPSSFNRRRHPVPNKPSTFTQRAIRSHPVAATNRVEHRRNSSSPPHKIFTSIIDGNAAKRFHQVVLWFGGGTKHLQSGQ